MSFAGLFAAPTPGLASPALAGALEGLLGVGAGAPGGASTGTDAGFAAMLVAAMGESAPAQAPATALNSASPVALAAVAQPAPAGAPAGPAPDVVNDAGVVVIEAAVAAPASPLVSQPVPTATLPVYLAEAAAEPAVVIPSAPIPGAPVAITETEVSETPDIEVGATDETETPATAGRTPGKRSPHANAHEDDLPPGLAKAAHTPAQPSRPEVANAPQIEPVRPNTANAPQVEPVRPKVALSPGASPSRPALDLSPETQLAGPAEPPGLALRAAVHDGKSPLTATMFKTAAPAAEPAQPGEPARPANAQYRAVPPPGLAVAQVRAHTPSVLAAEPDRADAAAPAPGAIEVPAGAPAAARPHARAGGQFEHAPTLVAARAAPASPAPDGVVRLRGEVLASETAVPAAPETPPPVFDVPQDDATSGAAMLVLTQQIASEDAPVLRAAFKGEKPNLSRALPAQAAAQGLAHTDVETAEATPDIDAAPALGRPAQLPEAASDSALPRFERVTLDDIAADDGSGPRPEPAAPANSFLASAPAAQGAVPLATPQTVTQLAAQIAQHAGPKASRFTVQLDPAGLGKVDVRVEISVAGELTAALSFHNPHAAQELSAKASELQTALQQAGFDPSRTALSFSNDNGASGQHLAGQQQQQHRQAEPWRHASFVNLADPADSQIPVPVRSVRDGGVDVTV